MANAIFFCVFFFVCCTIFRLSSKLTASFYRLSSDLVASSDRQRKRANERKNERELHSRYTYMYRREMRSLSSPYIHIWVTVHTVPMAALPFNIHISNGAAVLHMSKCRCLYIGQHKLWIEWHLLCAWILLSQYTQDSTCIARCADSK